MSDHQAILYKTLKSPRCRLICQYIADNEESVVTLEELTTHVTTEEQTSQNDTREVGERHHHTAIDLHHVHLPKLTDADILKYEHEQGLVESGPAFPLAIEFIQTVKTPTESIASST